VIHDGVAGRGHTALRVVWVERAQRSADFALGFLRATGGEVVGEVPALATVVTEGTDWDAPHERHREPAPEPRLVRDGAGRGPLAGGCLPRVTSLTGTRWQIPTAGRILVLETPQHPFTPGQALDDLWHLRHAGLLDDLAGLVVGWPFALDQVDDLEAALRHAVPLSSDYPVLLGRPFGHTSPFLTLPLGVEALLEGHNFRVVGRATADCG
jgi:muramoyltetrapeptide carboxypeptidase